jgi:hypothetical protein
MMCVVGGVPLVAVLETKVIQIDRSTTISRTASTMAAAASHPHRKGDLAKVIQDGNHHMLCGVQLSGKALNCFFVLHSLCTHTDQRPQRHH